MAFDWSYLNKPNTDPNGTPPERPSDGSAPRPVRKRAPAGPQRTEKRREVGREEPGAGLPVEIDQDAPVAPNVTPEARERARGILDTIGRQFAENRKVSQSQAYEIYQKDVADNAAYLIQGGILSMKELSELLMKLEEFRKRSSESGKTPATLLAEWLRGETAIPGVV